MLTDHIFIATEQIFEKISHIQDFSELLKEKLIHMILSHHGKKEYGTPVEPKFPEASALSCADLMGSQITQYIRAKKEALPSLDFKSGWNEQLESYVFLQ